MELKLDTRQFDLALKQYAKTCQDEFSDILNRTAFDVARWSIDFTKRSDKTSISEIYKKQPMWSKYIAQRISEGKSNFSVYSRKTGVRRRVHILTGYKESQAKALSKKIIAARIRSRSFLAAGWLWAVQKLAKKLFKSGAKSKAPGIKASGKPKGYAVLARPQWTPMSEIAHMGLRATKFSTKPKPNPIVNRALQMAINKKTVDFRKVIISRMQKLARKHSAR